MKSFFVFMFVLLGLGILHASEAEITVQVGHTQSISCISSSSDGKYIISGGQDKLIKFWGKDSGREIRTIDKSNSPITALCFIPNTLQALAGTRDGIVRLWDLSNGKLLRSYPGFGIEIRKILTIPGSSSFVCADTRGGIYRYKLESGAQINSYPGLDCDVILLEYRAQDEMLFAGSDSGILMSWDLKSGAVQSRFDAEISAVGMALSLATNTLVITDLDSYIFQFNPLTGKLVSENFVEEGMSFCVKYFPDGKSLLIGNEYGKLLQIDPLDGRIIRSFKGHEELISDACFLDSGKGLVTSGWDKKLLLWDVVSSRLSQNFGSFGVSVYYVDYSVDGRYLLTGSDGGLLKLWDAKTGKQIRSYEGNKDWVSAVKISDSGIYVLSGSGRDGIRLYNLNTGEQLHLMQANNLSVYSVAFSKDEKLIATGGSDYQISIWETTTGKLLKTFSGHKGNINELCFSPSGGYIASASSDRTIIIWNLETGAQQRSMSSNFNWFNALKYSPDGKKLYSGGLERVIQEWDAASGTLLRSFPGHTDEIRCLAITPDGKLLASSGDDMQIKIWDLAEGKELASLAGHSRWVKELDFSPDGSRLVSVSPDCYTKIWDVPTGDTILNLFSFRDGSWLSVTPSGFYDYGGSGATYLNVSIGSKVYSMDSFFENYFRPDLVQNTLAGVISPEDKASIGSSKAPPRVVLSAMTNKGTWEGIGVATGNLKISSGSITLKIQAYDNGGGIKELRLFHNNKIIELEQRGLAPKSAPKTLEKEYRILLVNGVNSFVAFGFADDMTQSDPARLVVDYAKPGEEKPDMYIIAIGINNYKNSKYKLSYCLDDCNGFVAALFPKAEKLFGKVHITKLTDESATRENFLQALQDYESRTRAEDVLVLYYAGHGIALPNELKELEFFFVLRDATQMTDLAQARKVCLSDRELRQALQQNKANKQLLFLDACNSGAMAQSFVQRGAAEENALAKLSRATGTSVFAATTTDQFATEFAELGHGIFTYALLEALSGKAADATGQITNNGIKSYIDNRIPELSRIHRGSEQYPTTFSFGQDYPIGLK